MNKIIEISNKIELYSLFPKNGVGAELGVCQGDNAILLYNYTQPSSLYLIDIWIKNEETYKHCPSHLHYDDWMDIVAKKLPHSNVHLVRQDTIKWLDSIPDDFLIGYI